MNNKEPYTQFIHVPGIHNSSLIDIISGIVFSSLLFRGWHLDIVSVELGRGGEIKTAIRFEVCKSADRYLLIYIDRVGIYVFCASGQRKVDVRAHLGDST